MISTVIKGFKFRLLPTDKQANGFAQTFGCVRKVRNELLDDIKSGSKRSIPEIKTVYPYTKQWDSQAYTSMWKFTIQAIKDYKKGIKGFPRFYRKYDSVQSYTTNADCSNLKIDGSKIYLRKIGWVDVIFHRELPVNGKVKAATIKREAGEYYISLRIEDEIEIRESSVNQQWMIGLDYSPNLLYVDQDGNSPEYVRQYLKEIKLLENKVKVLNKKLSRKTLGSNNWIKLKQKLQKLYKYIANKRRDFLHKESRKIVNTYDVVVVEDLDLKSMGEKPEYNPNEPIDFTEASKAKRRRKGMFRAGYNQFTKMLRYKLEEEGKELIQVSKWYKSTKRCQMCHHEQDMPTNIRIYECEKCGHIMNRDQNAAYNLIDEGLRLIVLKQYPEIQECKWITV